ncbi:MAG: ribulose-phosphate 3-epimerase [Candidatus Omnitrophica bacterium]|jgi:ribulose-phosphate 3-epimerase|nr:ribulose-phosphate 3-epimerase [Candidatus Omnitrophota bacterium]MDD5660306.1 ribulose-phosphate 3-epimerase [Candidatus Omnitrophota bacterium]
MNIRIAPSILSADFSKLGSELKKVENAGADLIHVDVMDGHFVPNITIGPVVVKYMRKATKLDLDVHLMIENPAKYVDAFVKAGSDMITVHIETVTFKELVAIARKLKSKGIKLGISLNPATPLVSIKKTLGIVDFVLIMSVNPGFGGQAFMPQAIDKIRQLRLLFNKDIFVDGGINDITAKIVKDAGANVLVAGSYIFGAKNTKSAINNLRRGET